MTRDGVSVFSWLWRGPLYALGGGVAVALALLGLALVIGVVILLVRVIGKAPLVPTVALAAAAPAAFGLGVIGAAVMTPLEPARRSAFAVRRPWLIVPSLACLAALGYGFGRAEAAVAQNHSGASYLMIGGFVLVTVLLYRFTAPSGPAATRPVPMIVPSAAIAIALLLGAYYGKTVDGRVIRAYCNYGAVSTKQLNGCLEHVTAARIRGLDTDAADFARERLNSCLADAGPFCEGELRARNTVIDGPEP